MERKWSEVKKEKEKGSGRERKKEKWEWKHWSKGLWEPVIFTETGDVPGHFPSLVRAQPWVVRIWSSEFLSEGTILIMHQAPHFALEVSVQGNKLKIQVWNLYLVLVQSMTKLAPHQYFLAVTGIFPVSMLPKLWTKSIRMKETWPPNCLIWGFYFHVLFAFLQH